MSEVIVGSRFVNFDVGPVSSLQQLVAPATNTNGLFIRRYQQSAVGAGTTYLFASKTTPASATDTTVPIIATHHDASTSTGSWMQLPFEVYLPAGTGLWFGSTTGGSVRMTYDLA